MYDAIRVQLMRCEVPVGLPIGANSSGFLVDDRERTFYDKLFLVWQPIALAGAGVPSLNASAGAHGPALFI